MPAGILDQKPQPRNACLGQILAEEVSAPESVRMQEVWNESGGNRRLPETKPDSF